MGGRIVVAAAAAAAISGCVCLGVSTLARVATGPAAALVGSSPAVSAAVSGVKPGLAVQFSTKALDSARANEITVATVRRAAITSVTHHDGVSLTRRD